MDLNLFRLLEQFSRDCTATKPFDLDTLGLAYMRRAYELGKYAARAETGRDRSDANYPGQADDSENGGEGGRDPVA